jgi:plastocyanin
MRNLVIGIIVIILLIIGVMALSNRSEDTNINIDQSATSTNSVSTTTATTTNATTTQGSIREFVVTGTPFKFDVSSIKVKQGDVVKVTFKNAVGTHDWVLDDFNVRTKVLAAGAQETVQFVANKRGSFEYYCSVGNHRQQGMVGTLIVE